MYRVFLSHSRRDNAAAQALFRWLNGVDPSLKGQIFLDVNPETGIAPGVRWKSELSRAVDHCEAVVCLISRNWEHSHECLTEARLAESLNKRVFCARVDPAAQGRQVREWQICDLFPNGDNGVTTVNDDNGEPVDLATEGLARLLRGLHDAGIGAEHFPWPPPDESTRAPYRGWQPMDDADAAVFFGRDCQILRGMDTLRGMRTAGVEGLFVILGPSGVGKSSFLRAGLLPRLRRDPGNFLVSEIVRPDRNALAGDRGLAQAIWQLRAQAGPGGPALGEVKTACREADIARLTSWIHEAQREATDDGMAPTVVLPIDQGEELFSAEAGTEATTFLSLLGGLLQTDAIGELPLIAAMTIRADRYESLQNAPELLAVHTREFGDLKPMPVTEYKDVITGPAARATAAGRRLNLDAALVARLLTDTTGGADSLPLLALVLSRLYLDYGSTGRLTLANYEAMGGMEHIVEAEINTLLAIEPARRAQQPDILRSAFIPWLATIDHETDSPSRRIARWDELPPESRTLIDAMAARRLLVKDGREGETVVEVALESLLRQWDSLAQWLGTRTGSRGRRQPGPRGRRLGAQPARSGMAVRRRAPGRGRATRRLPHVPRTGLSRKRIPAGIAAPRGRPGRGRATTAGERVTQCAGAPRRGRGARGGPAFARPGPARTARRDVDGGAGGRHRIRGGSRVHYECQRQAPRGRSPQP
ncbi:nSTAND1 domain-containing NTPase [Nocardia niigatensis]